MTPVTITITNGQVALCLINQCTATLDAIETLRRDPLADVSVPGFRQTIMGAEVDPAVLNEAETELREIREKLLRESL
jgi:hypothetical protein